MGIEIERKFLVDRSLWKPRGEGVRIRQGYLSSVKERVVRVRVADESAFLTVKGVTKAFSRLEFEYPIPFEDATALLDGLCERPLIEKTRYKERAGNLVWEIDIFHGANEGLVMAEIELATESEAFERPPWLLKEVSDDPRYFNNALVAKPFATWGDQ